MQHVLERAQLKLHTKKKNADCLCSKTDSSRQSVGQHLDYTPLASRDNASAASRTPPSSSSFEPPAHPTLTHRRFSGTPHTKSHVGTLQSIDLKRDQPHHSPQKTSYAVLSSESSSHTGYICVLAVSPAQLFPSLVPHLLQHYTVIPHKGSILHTSMRSSDGHTRRDAFRWKGPNIKCTSVA